ncbi:ankyrin repeat-containing domain protein [Bisporella sp. PMI_857]|nr:ankyrin repeat-containing domain protein [Bisporella sp. PMI_857]
MSRSFLNLKIYLFVGIGGGVPHSPPCENAEDDIHLGDVVIGYSEAIGAPAIIQWDFGRRLEGHSYENTSNFNKPDRRLLSALGSVVTNHECGDTKFDHHLREIVAKNAKFTHPGVHNDRLFEATYRHGNAKDCSNCDMQMTVRRPDRVSTSLIYHRSTIISGNSVMQNGIERDNMSKLYHNARCFEMEAAGIIDDTRCLVIRGIADYADGHKNWMWHRYAAAAAAAFGKEFLLTLKPVVLEGLVPKVPQIDSAAFQKIVSEIQGIASQNKESISKQELRYMSDQQRECHRVFKVCTYEEFKNNNPERVDGTCVWVLEHRHYIQWQSSQRNNLLWISADPGCGKSVLSRSLIEKELRNSDSRSVCYFFFKDNEQQDRLAIALCSLLHQLFDVQPQLLKHAIDAWEKNDKELQKEHNKLWHILINAATDEDSHDIICVLDAMDECQESDRQILIRFLSNFYQESSHQASQRTSLKFLVTSRPYYDIESSFRDIPDNLPAIRLSGEHENDKIHKEIDLVIRERVGKLAAEHSLSNSTRTSLEQCLFQMEHRTYLWLHLAFEDIKEQYRDSLRPDWESVESLQLPSSVADAYEKILGKITKRQKPVATKILHIIVGAYRPLTISEMAIAFGLAERPNSQSYMEFKIEDARLEKLIRQLCGLFVFIKRSKIYLIHQTAKEFLVQKESVIASTVWRHCLNPVDSENIMARICIDYLLLRELDEIEVEVRHQQRGEPHLRWKRSQRQLLLNEENKDSESGFEAFLKYSAQHWPSHFRNSTFDRESIVLAKACKLNLVEGDRFNLWFPILWGAWRGWSDQPHMNNIRIAAFNGHDIVLRCLLETEASKLDDKDGEKHTALIWAAELGHQKVARLLVEIGANVNTQGGEYGNALQAASARGHEAIVKLLIEKGAKVDAEGGHFGNALQVASFNGHEAIVKLLIEKGAKVDAEGGHFGNALQAASARGHEAIVRLLIEKEAKVDAEGGHFGNALQAASAGGHEAIVKLLFEKGADVNTQGGEYGNALQAALAEGHEAVVRLLIEKEAKVDVEGGHFGNALQAASAGGHEAIVRLLIEKGADVNTQGGEYGNALQAASYNGHMAIVKFFISFTATVIDTQGRSAAHWAARGGHLNILDYLLSNGANPCHLDRQGNGILHYAASGASIDMVERTIQYYQMPQTSCTIWSPLHWACRSSNAQIVNLLLDNNFHNSIITTVEPEGRWTPYAIAVTQTLPKYQQQKSTETIGVVNVSTIYMALDSTV